jgi:hypothetical protein
MGSGRDSDGDGVMRRKIERDARRLRLPQPTASYRRRAWIEFQRALDPLAPLKPLPRPRV